MNINFLKEKALKDLTSVSNKAQLERLEKIYFGRKGKITKLFQTLAVLNEAERRQKGQELNTLKEFLQKEFEKKSRSLEKISLDGRRFWLDVTAPGRKVIKGTLHPLTQTIRRVCEIFGSMGFSVVLGPEIESEYYNFDALNIPENHPARDMWDTFWLKPSGDKNKVSKKRWLLRTHTSPVQIRYMERHQPPFKIIAPGRCFRHEATDPSHDFQMYQLEGLMVTEDVTASHFKGVIEAFLRSFFEREVETRLRPSFFPFTEPSFEVDFKCLQCRGRGCSLCKKTGWLEMMGAGMVHPKVFEAVGYDSKKWQGFAFGMGLDRLTMMKYGIPDIRLLYSGDLRVLSQF